MEKRDPPNGHRFCFAICFRLNICSKQKKNSSSQLNVRRFFVWLVQVCVRLVCKLICFFIVLMNLLYFCILFTRKKNTLTIFNNKLHAAISICLLFHISIDFFFLTRIFPLFYHYLACYTKEAAAELVYSYIKVEKKQNQRAYICIYYIRFKFYLKK